MPRRFPGKALFVIALFVLLSAPCQGDGGWVPFSLQDMEGRQVPLSAPPVRIISLAAGTTEVLFSLGLGDRIVGVSGECNYPPQAAEKPKVGNIYLNYERIVSLRPDMVVVESSLRPEAGEKLRKLGLTVLTVRSDNFADFLQSVELMGRATGRAGQGAELCRRLQGGLDGITKRIKSLPLSRRPRVFVEIWNQPLMTAGGDTFISYVVERAGGVNICGELKGCPLISPETLLVRNPDVVILTTSTPAEFLSVPYWRNINAVKSGRVHYINPDILVRPGMRLYDGCSNLFQWFYPRLAGGAAASD